eukprot:scaffold80376_cov26-Tisochrysis_lutea.AAC.4
MTSAGTRPCSLSGARVIHAIELQIPHRDSPAWTARSSPKTVSSSEIVAGAREFTRDAAVTTSRPSAAARRYSASARAGSILTRIRPLIGWGRGLCSSTCRITSPATRVSIPTIRSLRATGESEQSIKSRRRGGGGAAAFWRAAPPKRGPRLADLSASSASHSPASLDASASHEREMASSSETRLVSGGGSHSNTGEAKLSL